MSTVAGGAAATGGGRFRVHGTVIAAPFPLRHCPTTEAPARLTIAFGRVPDTLTGARATGLWWQATADEVRLVVPGVARYHVERHRGITIEPDLPERTGVTDPLDGDTGHGHGDRDGDDDEVFLTGLPLAAALGFAGSTVLHGAAADTGRGAVLCVGDNGAGKSSLAAALSGDGGRLLCDNLAALDLTGSRPLVHCGPRAVHLWEDSSAALGLDPATLQPIRAELRKYRVPVERVDDDPGELRAVISIVPSRADRPVLTRLEPMEAVATVMTNLFRAKMARVVRPATMADAGRLASDVAVLRLERPRQGWPPHRLAAFVAERLG